MFYALAVLGAGLLAILYRVLPTRKMFAVFCLVLFCTGAAVYVKDRGERAERAVSEAERNSIMEQQQIFAAWFAAYQKDVEQLDRNWQLYHNILTDFKNDDISVQTAYLRLTSLEEDSRRLAETIAQKKVPPGMYGESFEAMASIIKKTAAYAAAQHHTIMMSRNEADPTNAGEIDPETRRVILTDILIRESPEGLFVAKEIAALKYYLTVPD